MTPIDMNAALFADRRRRQGPQQQRPRTTTLTTAALPTAAPRQQRIYVNAGAIVTAGATRTTDGPHVLAAHATQGGRRGELGAIAARFYTPARDDTNDGASTDLRTLPRPVPTLSRLDVDASHVGTLAREPVAIFSSATPGRGREAQFRQGNGSSGLAAVMAQPLNPHINTAMMSSTTTPLRNGRLITPLFHRFEMIRRRKEALDEGNTFSILWTSS
ncbi:hypothetical protein BDZ89DRAFT_1051150 [Hymenopellis radicata]|nr:hypothetical protein BDZ89DRAFT_1051150 [Hymenopellis radicata]